MCIIWRITCIKKKHQNRLSTIPNNNSNTGGGGGGGGSGNSLTGMMDYNTAENLKFIGFKNGLNKYRIIFINFLEK